MKHLKTYENNENVKKYWILPTDDRFEQALITIQCPPNMIRNFMNNDFIFADKYKYTFICFDPSNTNIKQNNGWGWDHYTGKKRDEYFDENGFIFNGMINIANDDPKLDKVISKYNL